MNGLATERLRLRVWEERDRPVFHRLNSDDAVMRFFPYRRTRAEADAAMDEWNAAYARTGIEFLAAERRADGAVIGMAGLGPTGGDGYPFAPTVQIGWRLVPEAFGQGYATEAAATCLEHGFDALALPEIVSYCAVENMASERVMIRLGMRFSGTFGHPKVDPATHPHLVEHKLYRLERERWLQERRPKPNP